ncbi:MAG: hypothetical protein JO009_05495 [Candidatus Eremiobacteraeota bacterium]|nr:hypothetical protein [Candidatus Eremiobacteraeota bacterium]
MAKRRTRLIAAVSAIVVIAVFRPAAADPLHPTVALRASFVGFYPGHLVLDGIGGAELDDGTLRVHADRIILDMRAQRYVAAGTVTVQPTKVAGCGPAQGDALGVDLTTRQGVLVNTGGGMASEAISGATIGGPATLAPGSEPLALPDVGLELPYARATAAVAHLGADVRLRNAHVIVPGGESIGFPSYVYSYSSNPGYSNTNINTNGEDLPIYFGSTADSVQGVHLSYNTVTKLAFGLDSHFVGARSYVLLSGSPLNGPTKVFNLTWQDNINDHTTQTLTSSTTTGIGTTNSYDLRDSVHRSFFELTGSGQPGFLGGTFAWQSFDQYFGSGTGSKPYYYLRTEYGGTHVADQASFAPFPIDAVLPNTVWHTAAEGYLGTPTWDFGQNVSLYGSADLRGESDTLPHRQVSQVYRLTLYTRWTRALSATFSDSAAPVFDDYRSVDTIYHSRINFQTLTLNYDNGDPFALLLTGTHAAGVTDNPAGLAETPWEVTAQLRFRATRSLSIELTRSYFFGYNGERFSGFGVQLLP